MSSAEFALVHKVSLQNQPVISVAAFPWEAHSWNTLWGDNVRSPGTFSQWESMVQEWGGSLCVGSIGNVMVFPHFVSGVKPPVVFQLPKGTEVKSVAWLLSPDTLSDPLIAFSVSSVLYLYYLKSKELFGYVSEHGGEITSINIHPTSPLVFCTTSKDMTTRLYDLTLNQGHTQNNPGWPPSTRMSFAGPAFGLSPESGNHGRGCCIVVFVGGQSGGHQADVLGAIFHSTDPLIVTFGTDCCIKIWRIPPPKSNQIVLEDKPLFSTSSLHKSCIKLTFWLNQDILISCSEASKLGPGSMVIWHWLGFNRFFPPGPSRKVLQTVRGCASDFRDSENFKILSEYQLFKDFSNICASSQITELGTILLISFQEYISILDIAALLPNHSSPISFGVSSARQELIQLDILPKHCIGLGNTEDGGFLNRCEVVNNGRYILGIGNSTLYSWKFVMSE